MKHSRVEIFLVVLVAIFLQGCGPTGETDKKSYIAEYEVGNGAMSYSLPVSDRYKTEKDRIYNIVQNQARYLISTVYDWHDDPSMKLLTESKSGEHHIRPNAHTVTDLAFLYRFGDYNPELVGCSRQELLDEYIVPMVRYLVRTHKTGDLKTDTGRQWGHAWQSALWTHALGKGAWWVWDELPADLRDSVRVVVADEADRIAGMKPPHNLKNDSKAEENAWNSEVLSVAVVLMPEDERRVKWEEQLQVWTLSSFQRPADEHSDQIVDGKPVSQQFYGANIFDDYTLENHGFIHPDYMAAWELSAHLSIDFMLTSRQYPQSCFYNIEGIYQNQKWFTLPDAGFVYPNGQDWRIFRNPDWTLNHALATVFFKDTEALWLLRNGLDCAELMQSRNKSGSIYSPGEYYFASAQHHLMYYMAASWLSLHYANQEITATVPQQFGVRNLEGGKIILNRTPLAVHTVAWGQKIMIQAMPFDYDRMISPDQRNGIGYIKIKGDKNSLPTSLESIDVQEKDGGFDVRLSVLHGGKIRADISVLSTDDGVMRFEETLTALQDITTEDISTCFWGVLNNANWVYEVGERALDFDGEAVAV